MNLQEILANDVGGPCGPGDYTEEIVTYLDDDDDDMSALPVVIDHARRLREVAEIVLAEPEVLCMEAWHSSCGTSHCLGGWAIAQAGEEGARLEELNDSEIAAYILLGPEAYGFFYNYNTPEVLVWLRQVLLRPLP